MDLPLQAQNPLQTVPTVRSNFFLELSQSNFQYSLLARYLFEEVEVQSMWHSSTLSIVMVESLEITNQNKSSKRMINI